jgi:peptidoglycan hydrolase-like protein with peptidoglycan-binding domain
MSFKQGYIGMEVQSIRGALAGYGFKPNYTVVDPNLFDAWVEAAVRAFQLSVGLANDGIVGPNTWAALNGTSVQPSLNPSAGASPNQPDTVSHPGELPTAIPGAGPASGNTTLLLAGGAAIALFFWWRSRKGGSTLAGLPFGAEDDEAKDARAEARKTREAHRRETAQRMERIIRAYDIELKRTEIDPVRAPGHAQALMNRVARAEDKAEEADAKLLAWQQDEIGKKYDPARRAEILREADADIKERTKAEAAQARAEMRVVRGELTGRAKKYPEKMYKQEHTPVGRKMFPARTSPTTSLRERTRHEDELWLERVDSARGAKQGTKRIQVQTKRYHTDKAYREGEQDDARRIAEAEQREVQLVNERGVALFKFQPRVGGKLGDAASEELIEAVANDARKGNCPKAVRNLFRVRPLALDRTTEKLLDNAAAVVAKNCKEELDENLEQREEAREEAGGERPTSAKLREVVHEVGLTRQRRTTAAVFTPKAIQREIEKGNISKSEGEALLIMARDEAKRIEQERQAIFDPPRSSSKMIRRRKGELEAHIYTSPEGRKRTIRK